VSLKKKMLRGKTINLSNVVDDALVYNKASHMINEVSVKKSKYEM